MQRGPSPSRTARPSTPRSMNMATLREVAQAAAQHRGAPTAPATPPARPPHKPAAAAPGQ